MSALLQQSTEQVLPASSRSCRSKDSSGHLSLTRADMGQFKFLHRALYVIGLIHRVAVKAMPTRKSIVEHGVLRLVRDL